MTSEFIKRNKDKPKGFSYADGNGVAIHSTSELIPTDPIMNRNDNGRYKAKSDKPPYFTLLTEFQTNIFKYYDLTETEAGILLMLCTYARFTDHHKDVNYIKMHGRYATNKDIYTRLKINRQQWDRHKRSLKDKDILLEDKNGMHINNSIMTRGYLNDERGYQIFLKPVQELYDLFVTKDQPKSVKYLGLFFSFIPYIQKRNNYLVMSEYDTTTDTYVYHDWDSLAKALGKKKATLKNDMATMNDIYLKATNEHLILQTTKDIETISHVDKRKMRSFKFVINMNVTFSSTLEQRQIVQEKLGIADVEAPQQKAFEVTKIIAFKVQNKVKNEAVRYWHYTDNKYTQKRLIEVNNLLDQYDEIVFNEFKISTSDVLGVEYITIQDVMNDDFSNYQVSQLYHNKKATYLDLNFA